MSDDQPTPTGFQVAPEWVDIDQAPIIAVNQMIAQVNQGEVFLTFGQTAPPVIFGTDDQKERQLAEFREAGVVPVRTVARLFMTPEKLQEVIAALNSTLATHRLQSDAEGGE